MADKKEPCRKCGGLFHIDELDAKPELGAKQDPEEGAQFTRLECRSCYGPGFTYGPSFNHLNKEA